MRRPTSHRDSLGKKWFCLVQKAHCVFGGCPQTGSKHSYRRMVCSSFSAKASHNGGWTTLCLVLQYMRGRQRVSDPFVSALAPEAGALQPLGRNSKDRRPEPLHLSCFEFSLKKTFDTIVIEWMGGHGKDPHSLSFIPRDNASTKKWLALARQW